MILIQITPYAIWRWPIDQGRNTRYTRGTHSGHALDFLKPALYLS
jgi:hypothetical protein